MPVDRDKIATQLGFKRSDIDMLLTMFSKNAATSLEEMEATIADNNMQGIVDSAHAIKGSAGNLKLTDIYELAMSIEMAAKNAEEMDFSRECNALSVLLKNV